MNGKLSGWEALILWALLAEGGESYWTPLIRKKMVAKDHAAARDALVRAGLVKSEMRPGKGKGIWIEVTDEGWRSAGKNLGAALPITKMASPVLQAWLARLQAFMAAKDLVLADLLGPQHPGKPASRPETIAPSPSAPLDYATLRGRIREAYLELTGGHFNMRATLKDVREKLKDIAPGTLDEALARMHLEDGTTLSGLNNPQEVTPAIRNAALSFKGEPMYVLWITK